MKTVVVVSPDKETRLAIAALLAGNGSQLFSATVVEAATGQDGLGEAVRCRPDVVLLDLGLPDMDGLQVLKRLREWSQTPVLIVSVRGHEDEKIAALDNGANDYIVKPFSTGELLNVSVPVVPDAPGASVPLLVTTPLTEPLPERVCAAPSVKPPVTADTSNTAPLATTMLFELVMERALLKASVPALIVVVPV